MKRVAFLLQKPGHLVQQGAMALRATCLFLAVSTVARASAAKSHRNVFKLQQPRTLANGIHAIRKVLHRGAAEIVLIIDVPPGIYVLDRERWQGIP